jgi:glycosyltransferase involved in cell wall biosynthesis
MKISIITVSYNSETTIKETINSVSMQEYVDKEHLIIDGASRDNTIEIVKQNSDKNLNVFVEKDKGIYYAMNKGLSLAKGDIIGFLNSDDFYASNNVLGSVAKTFAENPTLEACYSDLVYVSQSDTSKIIRYWKSGIFHNGSFSDGWCPPHPTFFVKRSVYEKYGNFNTNYRIASDAELMMRFLEVKKIKVKYIPEIWVNFRIGGISNKSLKNIFKQNFEVLKSLKNHKLQFNIFNFFLRKIMIKYKQFLFKP